MVLQWEEKIQLVVLLRFLGLSSQIERSKKHTHTHIHTHIHQNSKQEFINMMQLESL